jgi:hypothetical protein
LSNGYGPGHAPSLLDYGAFCGAAALVFAVVGLGAIFFESLQGIIVLALDGIASFFLLAGAAVSYPNAPQSNYCALSNETPPGIRS